MSLQNHNHIKYWMLRVIKTFPGWLSIIQRKQNKTKQYHSGYHNRVLTHPNLQLFFHIPNQSLTAFIFEVKRVWPSRLAMRALDWSFTLFIRCPRRASKLVMVWIQTRPMGIYLTGNFDYDCRKRVLRIIPTIGMYTLVLTTFPSKNTKISREP